MKALKRFPITILLSAMLAVLSIVTIAADTGIDSSEPSTTPLVEDGFVLEVDVANTTKISDNLYGLFFEDMNHVLDGGMYPELIKNGSFEFEESCEVPISLTETEIRPLATNGHLHGYTVEDGVTLTHKNGEEDESYLNINNLNYARIENSGSTVAGITNEGHYSGFSVKDGEEYRFSGFFKSDSYRGEIVASIENSSGVVFGSVAVSGVSDAWTKLEGVLEISGNASEDLHIAIRIGNGYVDADYLSVFPMETYKNTVIRKDIGELLEGLEPTIFRFPGGCLIEGITESFDDAYNWKQSVGYGLVTTINGKEVTGDISARVAEPNMKWNYAWDIYDPENPYYMTYELGFYEFFVLSEALGTVPIPVLNCGLGCQTRAFYFTVDIESEQFEALVQDMLDLVEFCNGSTNTYWGGIRASMGHPEPFGLEYVSIGNEQKDDADYWSRFQKFVDALDAAKIEDPELYGNIKLMSSTHSHHLEKIEDMDPNTTYIHDFHHYKGLDFSLTGTHRYDGFARKEGDQTYVAVTEWSTKDPTTAGFIEKNHFASAIADAAYMTGIERNGDVVRMACHSVLMSNHDGAQWGPQTIWFDHEKAWGSVNYYVQKMFMNNVSDSVVKTTFTDNTVDNSENEKTISGMAGVGTYNTEAIFDNIKVVSNVDGSVLYEDYFTSDTLANYDKKGGTWTLKLGSIAQTSLTGSDGYDCQVAYFGDKNWSNYTITFDCRKLAGSEGFIIPILVQDDDTWYQWAIGGWGNTVSRLLVSNGDGTKTSLASKAFTVQTNVNYRIQIVVDEFCIKGYVNGALHFKYDVNNYMRKNNGRVGLGTIDASATFDDLLVVANNGEVLWNDDFSTDTLSKYTNKGGTWAVQDGKLVQSAVKRSDSFDFNALYFGDKSWKDYTVTFKVTKTGGGDCFTFPIGVLDDNNWYSWVVGGWGNQSMCLKVAESGVEEYLEVETMRSFSGETNRTYEIMIKVDGNRIQGYIDGVLYLDCVPPRYERVYEVTGVDEKGNIIIKIVNDSEAVEDINIKLNNADDILTEGSVILFTGERNAVNTQSDPQNLIPTASLLEVSKDFVYHAPARSVSVIRISLANNLTPVLSGEAFDDVNQRAEGKYFSIYNTPAEKVSFAVPTIADENENFYVYKSIDGYLALVDAAFADGIVEFDADAADYVFVGEEIVNYGDANADGEITLLDVLATLKGTVDENRLLDKAAADITCDCRLGIDDVLLTIRKVINQ